MNEMTKSGIEYTIDEIIAYIDSCKPQMFSDSKIIVDRDELDELLNELQQKTPGEIRQYQNIIRNRDQILEDARRQADSIIAQAQIQTNELVSEHQIMQQAYAQANEVVMIATKQAQEILDNATNDANNIREGAISYTDELLGNMEETLTHAIDTSKARNEALLGSLQQYLDIVVANRNELNPSEEEPAAAPETPAEEPKKQQTEELPKIEIATDLFN